MTREVVTIGAEMRLLDAARLMAGRGVAGLTVVDRSLRVLGVLDEQDLVARLAPRRRLPWWNLLFDSERLAVEYQRVVGSTAGEVMRRPATTVVPDVPVADVAALFSSSRASAIPVVSGECLVGVIQRGDLLAFLPAVPGPSRPRLDDELAREMRTRMAMEPWVSTPRVAARGGVIELRGLVASEAERRALEAMARTVPGCRGVDSRLVARGEPGRSAASAGPWPVRPWGL
jgi:CBS domain-containing protein